MAHQVTFEISSSSSVTNVGIEDGLIRAICHRVTVVPSGREFVVCVDETATDHISASIRESKFQLPEHYHLVSRLMPAGSRVVDLGAHIGTFSLFCGALGFDVLAVEASPRNAALLKTSAEMSGFQNIEVVHSAVGETSGFISFLDARGHMVTSGAVPMMRRRPKLTLPFANRHCLQYSVILGGLGSISSRWMWKGPKLQRCVEWFNSENG